MISNSLLEGRDTTHASSSKLGIISNFLTKDANTNDCEDLESIKVYAEEWAIEIWPATILEVPRLSFSLSQSIYSGIALLLIKLPLFRTTSGKVSRLPAIIVILTILCQMTKLTAVITILKISYQMTRFSTIITIQWVITTTQMSSLALIAKWSLLKIPLNLLTSSKLIWSTSIPWSILSLTTGLTLSTRLTRLVLIIRLL